MPSPPMTASQSHAVSSRSRPSTKTCFGASGSACTARLSAHNEARNMLSRSIRAGEAKATENDAVAQISSNSSSRRSAVSRLESSMPLGIRFGSSTTAAATTGPASGPRPASSQPATGQIPRLISARSRRKPGGLTTAGLACPSFDLSRIMAGMLRQTAAPAQQKNGPMPAVHACWRAELWLTSNTGDWRAGPLHLEYPDRANEFRRFVSRIGEIAGVSRRIRMRVRLADLGGDPLRHFATAKPISDFRPQSASGRDRQSR